MTGIGYLISSSPLTSDETHADLGPYLRVEPESADKIADIDLERAVKSLVVKVVNLFSKLNEAISQSSIKDRVIGEGLDQRKTEVLCMIPEDSKDGTDEIEELTFSFSTSFSTDEELTQKDTQEIFVTSELSQGDQQEDFNIEGVLQQDLEEGLNAFTDYTSDLDGGSSCFCTDEELLSREQKTEEFMDKNILQDFLLEESCKPLPKAPVENPTVEKIVNEALKILENTPNVNFYIVKKYYQQIWHKDIEHLTWWYSTYDIQK